MWTSQVIVLAATLACAWAAPGHAQSCNGNSGMYYFPLEGFRTAAVVHDGNFVFPTDIVFASSLPLARRALESIYISPDVVPFSINTMYLEDYEGNRILVDTGMGVRQDFGPGVGRTLRTLEAQGIPGESITHLLLSHLHLDHVGGLFLDNNGTLAFPEATVYLSRVEYEYWRGFGEPFNATDFSPGFIASAIETANDAVDAVEGSLVLFEDGEQIHPNITGVLGGTWHSPGHAFFRFGPAAPSLGSKPFYYLGDSTLTDLLGVENPYLLSLFDTDRFGAPAGRSAMLDSLAEEEADTVFTHHTFPALARIVRSGLLFRSVPVPVDTAVGVETSCPAVAL